MKQPLILRWWDYFYYTQNIMATTDVGLSDFRSKHSVKLKDQTELVSTWWHLDGFTMLNTLFANWN